jgi:lysophospholipase L1-like esterase
MRLKILYLFLSSFLLLNSAVAQAQESLLEDKNGDGVISYLGFGDSITFGVGDTALPEGAGYVSRLGTLLGIPATNEGVPGEEIVANGVYRFPGVIIDSTADIVSVMEGTNDAIKRQDSGLMRNAYQRVINVARAVGKDPLMMTLPAPVDEHAASAPFTDSYSSVVSDVAAVNGIKVVDFRTAWLTTCQSAAECELYNLPGGLHPNGTGYDVMAQTLAATILGIDIFAADGAANLESALGLPPGTVLVKPMTVQQ